MVEPHLPGLLHRDRAAEANAAVEPGLLAARQGQMNHRQKVLVPADRDAVLRDAAEPCQHALVQSTRDLLHVAYRARREPVDAYPLGGGRGALLIPCVAGAGTPPVTGG